MPELVLRFGELPTSKPLRDWLAASGADQIVVDPNGGWNEPSRQGGGDPPGGPDGAGAGWAARLGEGRAPLRPGCGPSGRADAIGRAGRRDGLTEPGLHLALGKAHRDGDLVYTASSMPIRDQEAFLPGAMPTCCSSATAAPTGSTG